LDFVELLLISNGNLQTLLTKLGNLVFKRHKHIVKTELMIFLMLKIIQVKPI